MFSGAFSRQPTFHWLTTTWNFESVLLIGKYQSRRGQMIKRSVMLLCLLLTGCQSHIQTLTCPNGEPVVITDIQHAFAVYAPSYNYGLKATFKKLDGLEINATASQKQEITAEREKLSQESSQFQDALKTAILGLQTTPCDPAARVRFSETIVKINQRGIKLSEVLLTGVSGTGSVGDIIVTTPKEKERSNPTQEK